MVFCMSTRGSKTAKAGSSRIPGAVEVPINVYPVTWASLPDAQWPEMCHEDSETQGERAFDPFVPWKNWNAGELVTICHHIDLII